MTRKDPKISVVMPFCNTAPFIGAAVSSLVNQTYDDFELLVINDGSTDESVAEVNKFSDPRIRLYDTGEKRGIAGARNFAIKQAKGEYIALLDSDDIAYPDRLERQIAFLIKNLSVDILSSFIYDVRPEGRVLLTRETEGERIDVEFLFRSAIFQTALMVRGSAWRSMDVVYRPDALVEGYDLWVRMLGKHRFANLPVPLCDKRVHPQMTTFRRGKEFDRGDRSVRRDLLLKLGVDPSDAEMDLHEAACFVEFRNAKAQREPIDFSVLMPWFQKIIQQNEKSKLFNQATLEMMLDERVRCLKDLSAPVEPQGLDS